MTFTAEDLTVILTRTGNLFHYDQYACVPNASWGIGLAYEVDLLCLSKSMVFHDVEIKISRADIKADLKKHHRHDDHRIKFAWMAVPPELADAAIELALPRMGVVTFFTEPWHNKMVHHTKVLRRPKTNPRWLRNPVPGEVEKFLRLGVMRMWARRHVKATP